MFFFFYLFFAFSLSCEKGQYNLNNDCAPCPANCTSCQNNTSCLSCSTGFQLKYELCYQTCKSFFLVNNDSCISGCENSNYNKINAYQCAYMPPLISSIYNENYTFFLNHSCQNGTKIYFAYGLYYIASELSFEEVKEKWNNGITENDRLFNLQIQTIDLTKSYAEKLVKLQNVKNSGEPYSLQLFCEIKELYYQAALPIQFTSMDNEAERLTFFITTKREMSIGQKNQLAAELSKYFEINRQFFFQEDSIFNSNSVVSTFYLLPNSFLQSKDPMIQGIYNLLSLNLKPLTPMFLEKLKKFGVDTLNVTYKLEKYNSAPPFFIEMFPFPVFFGESIIFSLSLNIKGYIYFAWKLKDSSSEEGSFDKINKISEKIIKWESMQEMIGLNVSRQLDENKTKKEFFIKIPSGKEKVLEIYYWGENNGVPRMRSQVYGQIFRIAGLKQTDLSKVVQISEGGIHKAFEFIIMYIGILFLL